MRVSIHITCNLFLIFKKKNPGELRRIRCVSCLFSTAAQFSRLTGRAAGRRWRLKWIAGALKPIYLIDGWTRSVGLTSGANCKLDFFFFSPSKRRLCCCVTSVCHPTHHPPPTHSRRRNHSAYRYYEVDNSECVTSPETAALSWMVLIPLCHKGGNRRMETKEEDCSGQGVIDGEAKEMVWKNAASSSQLARHRFNLVHSPDLTVSQQD